MKKQLSNLEIVTLALYILGDGLGFKGYDLEDIATKADEIAPERFRWKSNPSMISDGNVWDSLSNARKKNYILEKTTQYFLTEEGINFSKNNLKYIKFDQSKSRLSKIDKEILENLKNSILNSTAYQKILNNDEKNLNMIDFHKFFRLSEYLDIKKKREKIQKFKNIFIDNKEIKDVIDKVASLHKQLN